MFRLVQFTLILLLLVLLGGCSNPQPTGVLTEKDAGTTVALKSGDTLIVQLKGNPSTGYNWEPENKDLKIFQMVGEPEFTAENKDVVGSAGIITLRFKAVAVGQEPLKLIYHRSWEKDVAPLQIFEVSIVVN